MTTETPTAAVPNPEPAGPPEPEKSLGSASDNLGNWLIGAAVVMALILALGVRFATSQGESEDPERRDAEIEFVRDRDRVSDRELDFVRDTYLDDEEEPREFVVCDDFDDDDAEARFADPECVTVIEDDRRETNVGLFGEVDEQINFDRLDRPTLSFELSDRGQSRFHELSIWVDDSRGNIDFAIGNPDAVAQNGNGVAIRTETDAMLLSGSEFVSIRRPDDCDDECNVTVWITAGPRFRELHPDAELVVYLDGLLEADFDELNRLPRSAYR